MDKPAVTPSEVTDSEKPWLKHLETYIDEPSVNKSVRQICYLAKTLIEENKIAWLLKGIGFIDLTTLRSTDTSSNVEDLCRKAVTIVKELPFNWDKELYPAAICVYPSRIKDVVTNLEKLEKSDKIKVASVAGGFPSGLYPLKTRLDEVRFAVEYGAQEIDVVIDRSLVLKHKWEELYDELVAIRNACNEKNEKICLKVILSTGELDSLQNVYKASMIAMFAGANFIKTSTGKEEINATLPAGIVMCRAIKEYERLTTTKVGIKPAGGIKIAQDALEWMVLVKEELGEDWLTCRHFRIGASSLLDDIIKNIRDTYDPYPKYISTEMAEVSSKTKSQTSISEKDVNPNIEKSEKVEKKTKPDSKYETSEMFEIVDLTETMSQANISQLEKDVNSI